MERVEKPWGYYEILDQGPGFIVKKIFVGQGKRTSLQTHLHRDETWVIVGEPALCEVHGTSYLLQPGAAARIRRGEKHRLAAPVTNDVTIVEVMQGEILDEDDIIRFEDDYGRAD